MSRSEILGLFEQYGILSTPQRLEVAEILLEKPQHLSADQIIDKLQRAGSRVSKATVYNCLKAFSDHRWAPSQLAWAKSFTMWFVPTASI